MNTPKEKSKLSDEVSNSLERIQNFDPTSLAQREKLGAAFNFEHAIEPAQKLVGLFAQIPTSLADQLPDAELNIIKKNANNVYEIFTGIIDFDPDLPEARDRNNQLVQRLRDAYPRAFSELFPLISYSVARTVDFNTRDAEARAIVRSIRDQTDKLVEQLENTKSEAEAVLDDVRKTAAEQGVTQEAKYFKDEADIHARAAEDWRKSTIRMGWAVGIYGFAMLFFHRIPFLVPVNIFETVQISIGKILVFFVLAYMLSLCAKNFLSHRHNEIVNRHRQNALLTYKTLASAGATPEARDIILNHAASSIYRMHDTGYTKVSESGGSSSSSIIEMLPKSSLSVSPPTN